MLAVDPLAGVLASIGRTERACTIHVFRPGGNGTHGPGGIAPGYGGVSGVPGRQLVSARYGAGVWWLDISARARHRPTASPRIPGRRGQARARAEARVPPPRCRP